MNLEQIDTSTTAGKAEVMRLAAEGRKVVFRQFRLDQWKKPPGITWNWAEYDYAIISEPVGPEEVWVILSRHGGISDVTAVKERFSDESNGPVVRYIRADLAGEKGE
ncbi:hypothetical protein B9Y74_05610 [Stenotrophomonas maltophilia]|uniref:hypothetical protein n=1 Tax=Stenotrophomonas maltophilia TaxID=40324 RepID=UPI000C2568C1|nr:hypothetical protein [Stenotrophomonas maltophilia]PJL51472.1 hypothetical protein B9Y74_05610 [Stenotrophomonas maltophilia]